MMEEDFTESATYVLSADHDGTFVLPPHVLSGGGSSLWHDELSWKPEAAADRLVMLAPLC